MQEALPRASEHLFNPNVEQQILGTILLDNTTLMKVPELLPEHFFDAVHQRIFKRIQARIQEGLIASPITLKTDLAADSGLQELGGSQYLVMICGASMSAHALPDYSNELRSLWAKREVVHALDKGVEMIGRADGGSATEVAAKVEADLGRIQMAAVKKPLSVSIQNAMLQSIQKIGEAYRGDTGLAGISTGLNELDGIIGGFAPGRCYVLAGRPAMGKSGTALNIAARCAIRGDGAWFGSLEMPATELANRFLSQMMADRGMKVAYSDIERGKLTEDEFRTLLMTAKEFDDLPLEIGDPNTRTFSRVRAAIKRAQDKLGDKMKLIVIDYLQKLIPPGNLRELDRISACAEFCKNMALETELPSLALAQLSRGVESRDNKRPMLSDLRGSGEIEQEADTVIFAYRDAYYLENQIKGEKDGSKKVDMFHQLERTKDDLELIVAKQRGGRIGTAIQHCELAYNMIGDKQNADVELPF